MRAQLLEAIAPHVIFDGWSRQAFEAAAADVGLTQAEALQFCPRGALDLAVLAHKEGDARLKAALAEADLSALRIREKVSHAILLRLQLAGDVETLRSASSLFALPHRAPEGLQLIWGTADAIWRALEDTAQDGNWYTKRATLAAVYSATLLYWLGDESEGRRETAEFVARRIAEVMAVEKAKSHPILKPVQRLLGRLSAPVTRGNFPGRW